NLLLILYEACRFSASFFEKKFVSRLSEVVFFKLFSILNNISINVDVLSYTFDRKIESVMNS
ncbi:hypothetical protein MZE15_18865, partial [Bacillus velezensis]|uniref:hypothetical protein n=1 Tax=Bacillus velezensis TaxID=492670 RepID=UPI00211A0F7E